MLANQDQTLQVNSTGEPQSSKYEEIFVVNNSDDKKDDKRVDFPEGGLEAWKCVLGTWCCTFMTFDKTSSEIAWIGSFQYFLLFAVGIFTGNLFDLGLFRPSITAGMVLLIFSQMMLSFCTKYYQIFLAQGIGLSLGFGLVFNLAVACPTHWFNKRRATAMGIAASGSSTGGVIFPILTRRLIDRIGFGWTMRVIAFFGMGVLTIAWVTLRTRLSPKFSFQEGGFKSMRSLDFSFFRSAAYDVFSIGYLLTMFGVYVPHVGVILNKVVTLTYMDVFTGTYKLPADGYYLSILNGASIVGRILPGFLADRFGRFNTLCPSLLLDAILIFVFPLCTNFGGILSFALLYGFTSGGYLSLLPACVAQLGPTYNVGTRLGMMYAIGGIGNLFSTPIAGAILGVNPPMRWWPMTVEAGILFATGTVLIFVSRQLALGKWVFWGKV